MTRIVLGPSVPYAAAASTFDKPVDTDSGVDISALRVYRATPPDIIARFKASGACEFDKAVGVYGMTDDDTWGLIEGPLFNGGTIQFIDGVIARDFAVAVGGYKRLAIGAFDGTQLSVTDGKTVLVSFIPAYST